MTKPTYRQIMEQHLGRKLKPTEIVHHIDGDQCNDSIENLQLVQSKSEHYKIHAQKDLNAERIQQFMKTTFKDNNIVDALKLFFTERQLEIVYKRISKKPLSKTEREYFSRNIKPILKALAHPGLARFCETIAWELL